MLLGERLTQINYTNFLAFLGSCRLGGAFTRRALTAGMADVPIFAETKSPPLGKVCNGPVIESEQN
jgi:hypothetical protein